MADMGVSKQQAMWMISLSAPSFLRLNRFSHKVYRNEECSSKRWKQWRHDAEPASEEWLRELWEERHIFRSDVKDAKIVLRNFRGINSPECLGSALTCLGKPSSLKYHYESIRAQLLSLSPGERMKWIRQVASKLENEDVYESIVKTLYRIPAAGIMAHDISEHVALSRIGAVAEYLSLTEAIAQMRRAAVLAQQHYNGFMEFATAAHLGSLLSGGWRIEKELSNQVKQAVTCPVGYWRNLPWSLVFDDTSDGIAGM